MDPNNSSSSLDILTLLLMNYGKDFLEQLVRREYRPYPQKGRQENRRLSFQILKGLDTAPKHLPIDRWEHDLLWAAWNFLEKMKKIGVVDVKELSTFVTKSIKIRHAQDSEDEPDESIIEVLPKDFDYAVSLAANEYRAWHHLEDDEPVAASKAAYDGATAVDGSEKGQVATNVGQADGSGVADVEDESGQPALCDIPLPSIERGAPYSFGEWELHPGYKPPIDKRALNAERVAVWQIKEHEKALADPDNVLAAEVAKWEGPSNQHIVVKVVVIKQEPDDDNDERHPNDNGNPEANVWPTSISTYCYMLAAAKQATKAAVVLGSVDMQIMSQAGFQHLMSTGRFFGEKMHGCKRDLKDKEYEVLHEYPHKRLRLDGAEDVAWR